MNRRKLRRIVRKALNESDIYPRPQHPMIANAGAETHSARVDSIADELMLEGMTEDKAVEVAAMILKRLKEDGLI